MIPSGDFGPYRGFHEVPRVEIENVSKAVLDQLQRLPDNATNVRVRLSPENFFRLQLQWLSMCTVFDLVRSPEGGEQMRAFVLGRVIAIEPHETAGDGIHLRWDVP